VREPRGGWLCATGHAGKLVRIADNGTTRSLGDLDDPELTALLRLADGSTLIAGAPSGNIYRLSTSDELTTAATLEATFVWRMVQDSRGDIWAATGSEGKLFRLRPGDGAKLEVKEIADLESVNLLDLWIDETGRMGRPGEIYVAGQDPGWVYRVAPDGDPFSVLFNAQAEEVRAMIPHAEGLALALNTERAPTPKALNLTMRMSGGQVTNGSAAQQAQAAGSADANKGLEQAFASGKGQYGAPRSEIVVLGREGFARALWTSKERPLHSIAASPGGGLLAAAGDEGRLYEVGDDGEYSVVADLREDYLVRIVGGKESYLLATARNGKLFQMDAERSARSVFLSQAIDARLPVAWGHFYLQGRRDRGQKIQVAFRNGNDGDVESKFWSEWSADKDVEIDQPVALPHGPARFVQYRLKLQGKDAEGRPPRADGVEMFYREPNAAPRVERVEVDDGASPRPAGRARAATPPPGGAPPKPAEAGAAANGADGQREARSNAMVVKIQWTAQDPNGDTLRYAVHFRGSDEEAWKLIEDELTPNQLSISIGGVADGRYRFRVVADDQLANPPGEGMTSEKVSDEFTVDNTPPRIEKLTATVRDKQALIRLEGVDDLSILSSLMIDLDNGDAMPIPPVDGLLDQRAERFEWRTPDLEPGEHVATLALTDRRGNTTVKKALFTVDKP
jgi:hypothetical protein